MKYGSFIMKMVCLLGIVGVLVFYQNIAVSRAAIIEENEEAIAEVEAYNKQVKKAMAAASEAEEENNSPYGDGVFTGTGNGYGGPVVVEVTVEDGEITDIVCTEHSGEDPAYYAMVEPLMDDMVEAQGDDIDSVSGSTFSSKGLIDAVGEALDQAEAAK